MLQFSIIIAFRNRDVERVRNSLNSLKNQTLKSFELIFIDSGSDDLISGEIRKVVEEYEFAQYLYTVTKGKFWNKSNALNIGIKKSKGEQIIIYDIDLIVETDFLNKLTHYDLSKQFLSFDCYYLPKHISYQQFGEYKSRIPYSFVGLLVVESEHLKSINGYDEFYQVWGAEDDDVLKRLILIGLNRMHISVDEVEVIHQWHLTNTPGLPDIWYLRMVEHLFSDNKNKYSKGFGEIKHSQNRPAHHSFINKSYTDLVEVKLNLVNKTLIYYDLIDKFSKLKDGYGIYINFFYPQMNLNPLAQKGIVKFNRFMEKLKRNFRLINIANDDYKNLKSNIYSFLKYFIGIHTNQIEDYYLDWREDGFLFIIYK